MGCSILQIGELGEDSTITYIYDCGHGLTVDVMDVLMLSYEPSIMGCNKQSECNTGVDRVTDICINT